MHKVNSILLQFRAAGVLFNHKEAHVTIGHRINLYGDMFILVNQLSGLEIMFCKIYHVCVLHGNCSWFMPTFVVVVFC